MTAVLLVSSTAAPESVIADQGDVRRGGDVESEVAVMWLRCGFGRPDGCGCNWWGGVGIEDRGRAVSVAEWGRGEHAGGNIQTRVNLLFTILRGSLNRIKASDWLVIRSPGRLFRRRRRQQWLRKRRRRLNIAVPPLQIRLHVPLRPFYDNTWLSGYIIPGRVCDEPFICSHVPSHQSQHSSSLTVASLSASSRFSAAILLFGALLPTKSPPAP